MGQSPGDGTPGFRNDCNFMRVSEEVLPVDGASPAGVRRDSDPTAAVVSTGTSSDALRAFDNDQPDWTVMGDHQPGGNGHDVQRMVQGLAIGTNALRRTFGSGDVNSTGYVNSENSNSADTGLSPDTAHSGSNRHTPNSTTPSDPHSNRQTRSGSGRTSYETSPASSHQTQLPA